MLLHHAQAPSEVTLCSYLVTTSDWSEPSQAAHQASYKWCGAGQDILRLCEDMVGQAGNQSLQGDAGRRNLVTEESCNGLTPGLFTQIKLALQVSKVGQILFSKNSASQVLVCRKHGKEAGGIRSVCSSKAVMSSGSQRSWWRIVAQLECCNG